MKATTGGHQDTARLHVSKLLRLEEGDAHIIRNPGGVITDDEIRSLAISQRLLGGREPLTAPLEAGF